MMWNPIYKIRRPLPTDTMRSLDIKPTAHLWIIAAFGWRVLVERYGPRWWTIVNRYECWKYRWPFIIVRKWWRP